MLLNPSSLAWARVPDPADTRNPADGAVEISARRRSDLTHSVDSTPSGDPPLILRGERPVSEAELHATVASGVQLDLRDTCDLRETYLDTADGRLARHGLFVCHSHRAGQDWIQLSAAIIDTSLVFEPAAFIDQVPAGIAVDSATRQLLGRYTPLRLAEHDVLVVVFGLVGTRRRYLLNAGGRQAELLIDEVCVRRQGPAKTFCELILAVDRVDRQAFGRLNERLRGLPGFSLPATSRRDHALGLLEIDAFAPAVKPGAFAAADALDDVARQVCLALLRTIQGYQGGTLVGLDSEYLHKMRVATRRLRAALQIFGGCFAPQTTRALLDDLRWLAGELGKVRDLDVHLIDTYRWQAELGPEPDGGWQALREAFRQRWKIARRDLLRSLESRRLRQLYARAERAFANKPPRRSLGHPARRPVAVVALQLLEKRVRQFRRQARRCLSDGGAEPVHELRIRAKKLRYTAEFFRPLYPAAFRQCVARLAPFQDVLGRWQDNAVVSELIASLCRSALASGLADPDYAFVLGLLNGHTSAVARRSEAELPHALAELGGGKSLKSLVEMAETVAAALELADEQKTAAAPPRHR